MSNFEFILSFMQSLADPRCMKVVDSFIATGAHFYTKYQIFWMAFMQGWVDPRCMGVVDLTSYVCETWLVELSPIDSVFMMVLRPMLLLFLYMEVHPQLCIFEVGST